MKLTEQTFKTVFIVDPQKGERIHLAKQIKQEHLFLMTFTTMPDCINQTKHMPFDLLIFVLRAGKTEIKHLINMKKKFRDRHFILSPASDAPAVSLDELREKGFDSVHISSEMERTRELCYNLLWPGNRPPNRELSDPLANL
ncbi:MAG: hypothetical protein G3M78_14285 [Candidatus Nitrohelix vancouverensis]|uniref:Response regulatory domain-containing protein n=1 Tax=Candidatus Nitrohelix vancouverensis TaxID=2705534 RepID=A0A7T0C4U7_9BACT|nr:MAG: hypothetical protein G3M78_14285 [Candidatus Nitrohelix vancouverensis]